MKALICSLIVATALTTPALSAEALSLVGTWTGQRDRIANRTFEAFKPYRRRGGATLGCLHAGLSSDDGIGRRRDLPLQSRRPEHPGLLL